MVQNNHISQERQQETTPELRFLFCFSSKYDGITNELPIVSQFLRITQVLHQPFVQVLRAQRSAKTSVTRLPLPAAFKAENIKEDFEPFSLFFLKLFHTLRVRKTEET